MLYINYKNVVILIFTFFIWQCDTKCPPPEKPVAIPLNSKWIGGCDGGYWVEMVDSLSRIRIYHEISGELEMDADFFPENECQIKNLKQGQITAVDTEQIIVKVSDRIYCKFDVKLPAYSGRSWEIMKENGKN